jgi:hypothetical protein
MFINSLRCFGCMPRGAPNPSLSIILTLEFILLSSSSKHSVKKVQVLPCIEVPPLLVIVGIFVSKSMFR